eukprot:NODE_1289_length_1427_cov_0.792169.p2 type:complete len:146 gc:universal NODE_1289_length_1427_cov_0.792169:497-60(-)
MYALLLILLITVSIDCPVVIQLALDLDIKYTFTEYFIQYEKDCCLGVGVVCENDRVVELHWGFVYDYSYRNTPEIHLPPNLRVLDLNASRKHLIIKFLPASLKVLELLYSYGITIQIDTFPTLTYFRYYCYDPESMPRRRRRRIY